VYLLDDNKHPVGTCVNPNLVYGDMRDIFCFHGVTHTENIYQYRREPLYQGRDASDCVPRSYSIEVYM